MKAPRRLQTLLLNVAPRLPTVFCGEWRKMYVNPFPPDDVYPLVRAGRRRPNLQGIFSDK
jgi:hypothetical protein